MSRIAPGTRFTPMRWRRDPGTFPFADAHDLDNLRTGYAVSLIQTGDAEVYDFDPIGHREHPCLIGSGISPEDLDHQQLIDKLIDGVEEVIKVAEEHPELLQDPVLIDKILELSEQTERLKGMVSKKMLNAFRGIVSRLAIAS